MNDDDSTVSRLGKLSQLADQQRKSLKKKNKNIHKFWRVGFPPKWTGKQGEEEEW